MKGGQLLKYKIGFLVIGLFTVAMLIVVLVQAGATKQDTQTDKLANSMADKLNSYTDSNFSVPASLSKVGITKTSPHVTYTRLSDSKYKFCITYKTTSSDFDPSEAVDNVLAGGTSSWDDSADTGYSSDLYIPTSHHKGVNCQTIDVGLDDGSGGIGGCGGPILNVPEEDGSTSDSDFACPLGSDGDSSGTGDSGTDSSLNADDSQRETDIDAVDAHLEAYYAVNGFYPTLADLNNTAWRSTNMQGLDASAVCDPSIKPRAGCQLTSAPQTGVYSYQVYDANGKNCISDQNCASFSLTATLSTGDKFTKQSNA